jgi:hypothetical protein
MKSKIQTYEESKIESDNKIKQLETEKEEYIKVGSDEKNEKIK